MAGLLDFIGTPEGQGLLSAAFGGLAGARQGTPFNNIGRAGVSGLVGYNQARDQDGELDQRKQRQQLFEMQLAQMQQAQADRAAERTLAEQSFRTPQQMAMAANGGPTNAAAAAIPTTAPGFDQNAYIKGLYRINPREAMALELANRKDDAPMILPEGATLVGGRASNFQPLASGAPKTASMSDIGKLQREMNELPLGDPRRSDYVAAIRKATTVAPSTVINNIPRNELGLAPKDRFDMEQKLGTDFTARTKLDAGIISTAQDIGNILKQGGALKDQAAIYKFAKALDPEGAVREADYAAIVKTAGGLDYVKALFNKALTGEQLTPNQRTEMTNLTTAMADVAQRRVAMAKDKFSKNAKLYQLNPDNIFQGIGEAADDTWAIVPPPGR
jgi:hypothetical protein